MKIFSKVLGAAVLCFFAWSCETTADTSHLEKRISDLEAKVESLILVMTEHADGHVASKKKKTATKPVTAAPTFSTKNSSQQYSSKSRSSYSGRCQATTKKGTQCKRNAADGSSYCWQHG